MEENNNLGNQNQETNQAVQNQETNQVVQNQDVTPPSQETMGQVINQQLPPENKNNKKIIIIAIVVVIVVIGVTLVFVLGKMKEKNQNNNIQNNNQVENNIEDTKENSDTNNSDNSSSQSNTEGSLLMNIEDVFTISGRGTVVTGKIERGEIRLNDEVEIVGLTETKKAVVTGIEMFRKQQDYATAGDNVGILLHGIERDDVERGQVIAKVGSIKAHTTFEAEIYLLKKEEGGRHTPVFNNYRPQFYFRTTDVTGTMTFINGEEMLMPGETITAKVELISTIAMEKGTEFTIREGGRTVGAGTVTKIIE